MPTTLTDEQMKVLSDMFEAQKPVVKPIPIVKKVEEKKIDLDKPKEMKKIISNFTEVFCYIFDVESSVYDIIQIYPYRDNYIVCDGVTYAIDRKMIMGRMKGYDPMMDMLLGFKKFTRWIRGKSIGVLMFQRPSTDDLDSYFEKDANGNPKKMVMPFYREIVEPITKVTKTIREDKKTFQIDMELVACKPILLKTITITPIFQDMIRSFKSLEGHGKMGKMWKWVLIGGVAIAIIFTIIYLFSSGILSNSGGV